MPIAKLATRKPSDPLFPIIFSVILASVLTVYPLSYDLSGWRPAFMFMVMLFWVMCQPTWCGIWFAFGTGLFADLLMDAPLGLNALSFVCITFFARYFTRERRILTFANIWVIALLAITVHIAFIFILQVLWGMNFRLARHWQPLLSTVLVWPVFYYMFKKWRI